MRFSSIITGLALGGAAVAHPGHNVQQEAAERRDYLQSVKRTSLGHCAAKLKARNLQVENVRRRVARVEKMRQKRGIKRRDLSSVLATDHNETLAGYTNTTDPATLFSGYNSYVAGEYVRENIIEDREGVDIALDYQVIDVDTCEPVPNVYVEIWHCNATGVYSSIVANGNGDSSDDSNINKTWLRGIHLSDDNGVAEFESIFPGHYTSRATHIHVMVHTNATLLANSTLGTASYASHVGQTFFDQSLITEVELQAPYNTNTQDLTANADDSILSEEADTEDVDPLMEYTLLGDSISNGLFAWIAFGINSTLSDSVTPAAYLYADGGVENSASSVGGGSNGGSGGSPSNGTSTGNGTAPSGIA
ncbi:intradiol ring-cleavage dioxygenase [Grosmannia clavigera kw1407]|uniref:Intradiol ring-cleavage dioxygenase n=1 Tax=Grosmannia clavigera (strain kw1407 / UAMH 11150) TaxID=655863 RepID=F0XE25_GROCL|nr:intradiol ring-cleavage dioxygenase [Grosmannia clavigera kw1407]EFX04512.1 intradiol ring-cleavage dioxygenase [Grosmannia clavigera kw1407]